MESTFDEIKAGLSLNADYLSHKLYQQQKDGHFCDIKLCIGRENWKFDAHKAVLAANSQYFEAMFTSSFVEKNQTEIHIDPDSQVIGSLQAVQLVLEFLYTNSLSPAPSSLELVMEVCQVAELWMVGRLKQLCEYFLAANLGFENCEMLLEFSKRNDCSLLQDSSLRFILSNMDDIAILKRGLFQSNSALFEELKALSSAGSDSAEEGRRTFIAFRKTRVDQYIYSGYLAKLNFPFEMEVPQPIGFIVTVKNNQIELKDLTIRLPNYIDRKMLDHSDGRPQDIVRSKIVSYAAIDGDIYFGISNSNKFSGILKYNLHIQTWDMLPFMPGTIEARMTKTRTEHVTFFVKETKEGKKLMVMNIQRNQFAFHENLLIIRSLEEGALVVEHEVAKVNIPSGSLFYSHSPNVVQVGEELFFVFKQELLVFDSDGLFHCITPRDTDLFNPALEDFRLLAVASAAVFEELIVLVHVKYLEDGKEVVRHSWRDDESRYRLNAFKYSVKKGFLNIPQPPGLPFGHQPINGFYSNDSVYFVGSLDTGERLVLSYNVMLNSWRQEKKFSDELSETEFFHTVLYRVSEVKNSLF